MRYSVKCLGALVGLSILGSTGAAQGAVVSNFSSVFDTSSNSIQFAFDIVPVDASTPLGVDSINLDFDNLSTEPFIAGATLVYSSVPGATGEILGTDEFIFDFSVLTSPTSLLFIVGGIDTSGLASDSSFDVDFFINTTAGATPSTLGEETISDVAFESAFTNGTVVVPVPEHSSLAVFGLGLAGLGLAARRRKTA